jgi:hypothetical protein
MTDAVIRYEGSVTEVAGEGIMALFGVPLAYEDKCGGPASSFAPRWSATGKNRRRRFKWAKTRYRPLSMKGLEPLLEQAIKIHVDLSHVFPVRLQSTIRPSGRAQSP